MPFKEYSNAKFLRKKIIAPKKHFLNKNSVRKSMLYNKKAGNEIKKKLTQFIIGSC